MSASEFQAMNLSRLVRLVRVAATAGQVDTACPSLPQYLHTLAGCWRLRSPGVRKGQPNCISSRPRLGEGWLWWKQRQRRCSQSGMVDSAVCCACTRGSTWIARYIRHLETWASHMLHVLRVICQPVQKCISKRSSRPATPAGHGQEFCSVVHYIPLVLM